MTREERSRLEALDAAEAHRAWNQDRPGNCAGTGEIS
jgi:hypothetical protein